MAALTFFNPASLLASPEAAVAPPPKDMSTSFLIGSALKEAGDVTKKYFDLQALKKETEGLAGYVQNTSPDLASYLRTKSSNYNLGSTDPSTERANLIKGVTELHDMEINKQKADNYGAATSRSSLLSAKLAAAQKDSMDIENAYQVFEKEENDREQQYKDQALLLAGKTGKELPPFQRRPNPYTGQRKQSRQLFDSMLKNTPDTTQTKGPGMNPAGYLPAAEPDLPDNTQAQGAAPDATLLTPNGNDLNPGDMIQQAPVADTPPQLTETPAAGTPSQAPPSAGDNAASIAAEQFRTNQKVAVDGQVREVMGIKDQLLISGSMLFDPDTKDKLIALADNAAEEIKSIPNPNTETWQLAVNGIKRNLRAAFSQASTLTIEQKQKQIARENQTVVAFKNKTTGEVYNYISRKDEAGTQRYYSTNADGHEEIVPKSELDQMSRIGPVTPTTPGSSNSKPSIQDSLRNLLTPKTPSIQSLQDAKLKAK